MPRPRTKAEDIINPEHYFNRYIACEVKHDMAVRQIIDDNEVSLEEKMEYGSFQLAVAVNTADELLCSIIAHESDGWIELLESECLRSALYSLSERQREVIRLYHVEGFKMPEIAVQLGLTTSAVSRHLTAAMKNLKTFFADTQLLG